MSIRTPDDERRDWLYAPFTENWWYQGATYPGHSDHAVDFNRRTKNGGWLQDLGDPVLAMQDGTVGAVDKSEGLVYTLHHGGRTQVELRHMQDIRVRPGQRVKRGQRIGSIGDVAGTGRSTAPHLHLVQYGRKTTRDPFQRVPLTIEGKRLPVSVGDSDTKPAGWNPPTPTMVQGPPPKATWEGAFRESEKLREKADAALAAQKAQTALATEERDAARAERDKALADLAACQATTPGDCGEETDRALMAEQRLADIRAVLDR